MNLIDVVAEEAIKTGKFEELKNPEAIRNMFDDIPVNANFRTLIGVKEGVSFTVIDGKNMYGENYILAYVVPHTYPTTQLNFLIKLDGKTGHDVAGYTIGTLINLRANNKCINTIYQTSYKIYNYLNGSITETLECVPQEASFRRALNYYGYHNDMWNKYMMKESTIFGFEVYTIPFIEEDNKQYIIVCCLKKDLADSKKQILGRWTKVTGQWITNIDSLTWSGWMRPEKMKKEVEVYLLSRIIELTDRDDNRDKKNS